jgi:photosystem II stability/assembly factor-like uncharacterized protein
MAGNPKIARTCLLVSVLAFAGCTRSVTTETVGDGPAMRAVLLGVDFVSRDDGFLIRCFDLRRLCPRQLLETTDGGESWEVVRTVGVPRAVDFVDQSSAFGAWAVCHRHDCRVVVSSTSDAGATWGPVGAIAFRGRYVGHVPVEMSFVSRERGWIAVMDHLFRTDDGGLTWADMEFRCGFHAWSLSGVSFVDARTGFVACEGEPATGMAPKAIFTTADAGRSWTLTSLQPASGGESDPIGRVGIIGYNTRLWFLSPRVGFFMADRDGIERTTDGGRVFRSLMFTDDEDSVVGTSWTSLQLGYVATYQGGLSRTDDGGETWTQVFP